MRRLRATSLYNKIILILIPIVLLDLSRRYYFLLLVLIIYFIAIRKNKISRYVYLSSVIFLLSISFVKNESNINPNEKTVEAEVINVYENYSILKGDEKFIIYNTSFNPGDILIIKGEYKLIKSNDIPYVFNFQEYMNNKGIIYQFNIDEVNVKSKRFNINIINYKLARFIDNNYNRADYYKALILSINDISNESISNLGIAHLLCISGLHINLILGFFKKVFKLKEKHLIFPLYLYLILLGFSIPVFRVVLTISIGLIFKKISKVDSISLSCLIMLIFNPNFIFDTGFILTYLVSYAFLLSNKHKMLVAYLISIPFSVSFNDKLNILSLAFNFLFSLIFYFLIPLTFICFFIRPLDFIYTYVIESFEFVIDICDIKYLLIDVGSFNSIEYFLYYLTLFLFLMKNKLYYFIYIVIHLLKGIIILGNNMIIFDVGQGDSTLIYTNNEVVMIDCYSNSYKFIKKRGIKEIDYLFITHSHNDHMGALDDLLKTVTVKNIVISYYDRLDYENVIRVKSGDVISTNTIDFYVLNPIVDDSNLNNISIVLQFDFLNKRFLYTGDIEKEAEERLVKKYKNSLKSDVLKVAHHGSNTSSGIEFIEMVNPTYSIISVGVNNYNQPDDRVLKRLAQSKIYKTIDCGSIYIGGFNSFHIIDI